MYMYIYIPWEGDLGGGEPACFLGPSGDETYEDSVDSIVIVGGVVRL
jgi:hypothetical protein